MTWGESGRRFRAGDDGCGGASAAPRPARCRVRHRARCIRGRLGSLVEQRGRTASLFSPSGCGQIRLSYVHGRQLETNALLSLFSKKHVVLLPTARKVFVSRLPFCHPGRDGLRSEPDRGRDVGRLHTRPCTSAPGGLAPPWRGPLSARCGVGRACRGPIRFPQSPRSCISLT